MQRYRGPAFGFLALAVLAALGALAPVRDGLAPATAFAVGYLAVSVWWIAAASRPARPVWPHALAVWLPALLPLWAALGTARAMAQTDNAALLAFFTFPAAAAALAACAAGALRLALGARSA